MNINSKLTLFASRELVISPNERERLRINASITQLKSRIRFKLRREVKEFILFGSYTRNTILPRKYDPNSDIDLMVIFNTANGIKNPDTYRNYLLDIIDFYYPNSISKKDFPAVKLELNHIMFDIVPAYTEESFLYSKSYYIPDSGNNWQSTVPNDINSNLEKKNQSVGNNIIRNTIRLCKHWNAFAGRPFESYLMENKILECSYFSRKNTFERFVATLDDIAGDIAGVRQALDYIDKYDEGLFSEANEAKQLQWLQKLLPELK